MKRLIYRVAGPPPGKGAPRLEQLRWIRPPQLALERAAHRGLRRAAPPRCTVVLRGRMRRLAGVLARLHQSGYQPRAAQGASAHRLVAASTGSVALREKQPQRERSGASASGTPLKMGSCLNQIRGSSSGRIMRSRRPSSLASPAPMSKRRSSPVRASRARPRRSACHWLGVLAGKPHLA